MYVDIHPLGSQRLTHLIQRHIAQGVLTQRQCSRRKIIGFAIVGTACATRGRGYEPLRAAVAVELIEEKLHLLHHAVAQRPALLVIACCCTQRCLCLCLPSLLIRRHTSTYSPTRSGIHGHADGDAHGDAHGDVHGHAHGDRWNGNNRIHRSRDVDASVLDMSTLHTNTRMHAHKHMHSRVAQECPCT